MCGFFSKNKKTLPSANINFKIIDTVIEWKGKRFLLNRLPGTCPYCQSKTHWECICLEENNHYLSVILRCSDIECHCISLFLYKKNISPVYSDTYDIQDRYCLIHTFPEEIFHETKFSDLVEKLSPNFVQLYHQAEQAEIKANTEKIAGIGFRKALEFLIKDYLISENKEQEEKIKAPSLTLGTAINNYCQDNNLKKLFQVATYLGNDETHYIRCWNEYDVNNLKEIINLSVGKIEDIIKTNNYCQKITNTATNKSKNK